ncbi:S41B peptidase family lipoprotein [Haloplasma contractile SSD-17B]|uniref:S41B peptidase family lipoprotein n=2 Tax=Haloplasma TaxID=471824 RepID=U2EDR8_9MOLU|nr:S41B peptidase family lipoprotein [Haloplasma contractile SSD-17B]
MGCLKRIVVFIFIFILMGCSFNNKPNHTNPVVDSSMTNESTTNDAEDADVQREVIQKSNELKTKDIAEEYVISADTLSTYQYKNDPHISYVNISEFISFMEGGIVDLQISKDDVMTISYSFEIPSSLMDYFDESTYTYELTIDAANDHISYNDFDMVSSINTETITQYETDLVMSDFHITDDDPSLTIDLSLYDMEIVKFEDNYYIPIYLANLFFTGSTINVYEFNDDIYVIDDFSDYTSLTNQFDDHDDQDASHIKIHTKNYLALYFDYFYGLKEFKEIDTYRTVLENYQFEQKDTYATLHKEVERFINHQEDLHTSVVSAGYMNKDFSPSQNPGDKLSNYINAYNSNRCYNRTKEVDYRTYDEAFVLEVNAFSLETRELLKPAMEAASNYNDIIIDVSCNPGGNIVAVFELLSYMTDEELQLSYINPATGGKVTEFYETTNNDFLNKNFYVYTTGATFSAANLFASIVKDQELGLIFGEKSSGGASAITYTVLPDGALIVSSSNLTMVNESEEVIEDGIEVDLRNDYPFNWHEKILDLTNLFSDSSDVMVDQAYSSDFITYNFNIINNSEEFTNHQFKVSVYDSSTDELIYDSLFNLNEFIYSIPKIEGDDLYTVEVSALFELNGISKREVIYTDELDDHSNSFNKYATEIQVDQKLIANSHTHEDLDIFKFTVSEEGLYRVLINEEIKYNHIVYDQTGNLVDTGYDFNLDAGVYYLLASPERLGLYNLSVNRLIDDATGHTQINLQEGVTYHSVFYDYLYDEESFELHVLEDMIVTFYWNAKPGNFYSIKKSNGEFISLDSYRIDVSDDLTVTLEAGTYVVKLNHSNVIGQVTLTTDATTDFVDYSGELSVEGTNYGDLQVGTNSMEFLTIWDRDIYYIDVTEEQNYMFQHKGGRVHYLNLDGSVEYLFYNKLITLSPGRHYFLFESNDFELYKNIDFNLIIDQDLNTETNKETLVLDQEKTTLLSGSTDIDYFDIKIDQLGTYELIMDSFSNRGVFNIIDSQGNKIVENKNEGTFIFTIPKGTYTIEISTSNTRRESISLYVTDSQFIDDALNTHYATVEQYEVIKMGFSNAIIRTINYVGDIDVYVIHIEESDHYQFHLHDSEMKMKYLNQDGEWVNVNPEYAVYLETGTYYLSIVGDSQYVVGYEKGETE